MSWHYIWTNQDVMSESDKYDNAEEIWDLLVNTYGWTEESAAAVLGNFQYEGLMNPAQWQIGSTIGDWNSKTTGLGLGQWTPPSKLGDYCGGNTEAAISNGPKQVEFTVTNSGQWVQRINQQGYSRYYHYSDLLYITSISEFSQSTEEPEELASCWCACWEGCSRKAFDDSYNDRRNAARYWYEEFKGGVTGHTVTIKIEGNGTAEANPVRAEDGESVSITATPNGNDSFIGWTVETGNITIDPNDDSQTFTMPNERVILIAEFTGETPVEPLPDKLYLGEYRMPIWMYPCLRT